MSMMGDFILQYDFPPSAMLLTQSYCLLHQQTRNTLSPIYYPLNPYYANSSYVIICHDTSLTSTISDCFQCSTVNFMKLLY